MNDLKSQICKMFPKGCFKFLVTSLLLCSLAHHHGGHGHFGETYEDGDFYDDDQSQGMSELAEMDDHEFYDCDSEDGFYPQRSHRDDIIDIISDTMPNIPEELINEIGQSNPGLLGYIIQRHPNFRKLVMNMEPSTIEHFCRYVPSFSIRLGELDPHMLGILREIYPQIGSCIKRPITTTTFAPATTTTTTKTTATMTTTTAVPKTTSIAHFLKRILDLVLTG